MKKIIVFGLLFLSVFMFQECSHHDDNEDVVPVKPQVPDDEKGPLTPEKGENLLGGSNDTSTDLSEEAFGSDAPNLTFDEHTAFGVGNARFRDTWQIAPSSIPVNNNVDSNKYGLGPFYNAKSCSACHFKDGRGRPPAYDGELGTGLLLRLSIPGRTDKHGSTLPDPIYGGQLRDDAITGQTAEAQYRITYVPIIETFPDGKVVTLQKPIYHIVNPGHGAFATNLRVSPRIAQQIIGLGLLEAVPESTILGFADENDKNGDGISGRPNYVHDVLSNSTKMGRFGWKSNQPTVLQQVAAALSGDIGITSSMFPDETGPADVDLSKIPNGGHPEISNKTFNSLGSYSRTLAVPVRRNYKKQNVLRGRDLFESIQCTACHIPKMQTGSDYSIASLRNQTIRPFTDLLLHDMGPNLADNAPDFLATGTEWRTQPLWGIGMIIVVNHHTFLLHDGRAKNVEEAILWHGGEAQRSKDSYKNLSKAQRDDLLAYINSL